MVLCYQKMKLFVLNLTFCTNLDFYVYSFTLKSESCSVNITFKLNGWVATPTLQGLVYGDFTAFTGGEIPQVPTLHIKLELPTFHKLDGFKLNAEGSLSLLFKI